MFWRDRAAIAAMFLGNGFTIGVWATQIPLLLPRFGISSLVLGLLILVLGLGAAGVMPLAGRLIGQLGVGRALAGFALPVTLALPLVALAPSLWLLVPAVLWLGLFTGGMDVSMNAAAVAVERQHSRAIMSQSHGFWSLGGFFGGALGALLSETGGPALTGLAAAAIFAALALPAARHLLARFPAPVAEPQRGPDRAEQRLFPRDPALWLLGLMALFAMVPEGAILDWAAIYLTREMAAPPLVAGFAFATFSGAMAIMRFAGDRVRMRLGAVQSLRLSGLLGALGLALAALAPHPILALAGFALAGLGIANLVPILFSAAGNHPGLPPGQAMSLVTMIGYSGILAAPGLIGFLADHIGLGVTYGVLSLLLIIVATLAPRAAAADRIAPPPPHSAAP